MKQPIIRKRVMIITIPTFKKKKKKTLDDNLLMTYNADKKF